MKETYEDYQNACLKENTIPLSATEYARYHNIYLPLVRTANESPIPLDHVGRWELYVKRHSNGEEPGEDGTAQAMHAEEKHTAIATTPTNDADTEPYELIMSLAVMDHDVLQMKGRTYGDSWRKRGGIGAFMMLARKWDRIETIATEHGYDIFTAVSRNAGDILDDIRDLRRYLLLVDAHVLGRDTHD